MAEFKRRTLLLNTGKQVKLYGTSMAIGKTLEIGEGSAPNIFSCMEIENEAGKLISSVSNPFKLSAEELQEIADYNIRLWLDFKDNLRKMGIDDPKIFNTDAVR